MQVGPSERAGRRWVQGPFAPGIGFGTVSATPRKGVAVVELTRVQHWRVSDDQVVAQ